MMSWIGFHKLTDAIFGITQKPPCITSSNLVYTLYKYKVTT